MGVGIGASVRKRKEDGAAGYRCVCVSYIQTRENRKKAAWVVTYLQTGSDGNGMKKE